MTVGRISTPANRASRLVSKPAFVVAGILTALSKAHDDGLEFGKTLHRIVSSDASDA